MYSKLFRVTLACVLTATTGCGIHLGEKAPGPTPISYSGRGYACIGQIASTIEQYVSDQLSEDEITSFARCLQKSFTTFAQMTRGRDQSVYTPEEIRSFLESYFLKDRKISDELLHEFMIIKQVLLGGRVDAITRTELFAAIDFIEDLRVQAILLKPHLRYLNPQLIVKQPAGDLGERLTEAGDALRQTILVFGNRLRRAQTPYPLADLEKFLTEFRSFVQWDKHFPKSKDVRYWVELLRDFKDITVATRGSGRPDAIREMEWIKLFNAMAGWYSAYLEYQVGVREQNVMQGAGLQNTIYLAGELFRLLTEAVDRQDSKTLTFEQLDRLIEVLHNLGWIPSNIKTASLDQTIRMVVVRMMGDEMTPPAQRSSKGIDFRNLPVLKAQFYRWAYVQVNLDSQYSAKPPASRPEAPILRARSGDLNLQSQIQPGDGSETDEFLKVREHMRPLFLENQTRVQLVPVLPGSPKEEWARLSTEQEFYNLSVDNLLHAIVSLVLRGYSEQASGRWFWTSGISSDEMQHFYRDIRNLGIDLGVVDKNNCNSGSRAFVEGKLFTYASKGLSGAESEVPEMSATEAMEYFAYLFSGSGVGEDFYAQLSKDCATRAATDPGAPARIEKVCAIGDLPVLIDTYMKNAPYLRAFLRSITAEQRKLFAQTLMDTVKPAVPANTAGVSDPDWVEHNEIITLAVIIHYAESVMTRFDENQDGILENGDIEQATPLFIGFIKKIANQLLNQSIGDQQARGVFRYILVNKKIPRPAQGWDWVLDWTNWDRSRVVKNQLLEPDLRIDRQQLAEVFQAIIKQLFAIGASQNADKSADVCSP